MKNLKYAVNLVDESVGSILSTLKNSKMSDIERQHYLELANQTDKLVKAEIKQFHVETNRLTATWQSLNYQIKGHGFNARTPRAVIPIIGDLLSTLFGVSTESNMNKLRKRILKLQSRQTRLVDVVQKGLTFLNKTHSNTMENRHAINKLANVTAQLHTFVQEVKDKLVLLNPLIVFVNLNNKLHHLFHLVMLTIQQISWDISELQSAINMVNNGQLPSTLVPADQLFKILASIRSRLPSHLRLPSSHTPWYYANLATALIPKGNKIYLIAALPLAHQEAVFRIYESFSVPVPNPAINLIAQYQLESKYIAISKDMTMYALLTEQSAFDCLQAKDGYCAFLEPIKSIIHVPSCITALFRQNQIAADNHCIRSLKPHSKFPIVHYLHSGSWLIATRNPFVLTVLCYNNNKQRLVTQEISKPIQIIHLNSGCEARSSHFRLLPYFHANSTSKIHPLISKPLSVNTLLKDIWNFSHISTDQLLTKINFNDLILSDIPPLPISALQTALEQVKQNILPTRSYNVFPKVFVGFSVILAVVGIAISGVLYYRYYKLSDFHVPIPTIQIPKPEADSDLKNSDTGQGCETDTPTVSSQVYAEVKTNPTECQIKLTDQATQVNNA